MNDNTAIALVIIGIALSVAIGTGLSAIADAPVSTEAAKAGLQQCVVSGRVIWQKECKE